MKRLLLVCALLGSTVSGSALTPMLANPKVSEAEVHPLVKWILSLK